MNRVEAAGWYARRVPRKVRGGGVRPLIVTSVLSVTLLAAAVPRTVDAQSPSAAVVSGGDTRSEGEGAGLAGSPVLVALGVVALGLAVAGATALYARVAGDD